MKFLAWAYLIAFGGTWVCAGFGGENGDVHFVGVGLLGLAWIIGLGLALRTLLRKESNFDRA